MGGWVVGWLGGWVVGWRHYWYQLPHTKTTKANLTHCLPICRPAPPRPCSRVRSLEGLQILDHTPGCVKTSAVVLRFYQALKAGQEYRDDMWRLWQSMHACEPPPPQDMAEAVMVGGLRTDYGGSGSVDAAAAAAAGGPSGDDRRLPSVLTAAGAVPSPSAFGGGGGRRATDICFRCKQPGHWGSDCPLYGNGGGSQQQQQQQQQQGGAAAGDRKRPAPGVPQQQQQQQQPAKRSRATRQGRNSAAVAAMPSSKASAIAAFFKPRGQKGAPAGSIQPAAGGGGGGGGAGKGSCFRCGGTNHWASACPSR